MFTLVSAAFLPSLVPTSLPSLHTRGTLAHRLISLATYICGFYIWLVKSARQRHEIFPKTAGKLCNGGERGHMYILYCKVAQQTKFVISEAGGFYFFSTTTACLVESASCRRRFLGSLSFPRQRRGSWYCGENSGLHPGVQLRGGRVRGPVSPRLGAQSGRGLYLVGLRPVPGLH